MYKFNLLKKYFVTCFLMELNTTLQIKIIWINNYSRQDIGEWNLLTLSQDLSVYQKRMDSNRGMPCDYSYYIDRGRGGVSGRTCYRLFKARVNM